ncbi:MAG: hypothetical protein SGI92_14465 [Bryobacteraceae bacterium]|nr:hypothetical protein [Bryobacteraceae bacterium]
MLTGYPAARIVAEAVVYHFVEHPPELAAARPAVTDLESLIDLAFWASLLREELNTPRVSLAFMPPSEGTALLFAGSIPLTAPALTKLAPAVERPGLHLGVWRDDTASGYCIWGVSRTVPPLSLVIEVVAPGLIVVKHSRIDAAKYANLAVLEGNRIRILDHDAPMAPNCPADLLALLRFDLTQTGDSGGILVDLAASMRQHGRGGSLLLVPARNQTWRESIVLPVAYSVSPPFAKIASLMGMNEQQREARDWARSLDRTIQTIAGLTMVDGATLISENYDVLAFGAKITRRDGQPQVQQLLVTEPVIGNRPVIMHPGEIGGTRHMSAAQFVQDQPDAIALVASQDGRFTVFAWSGCDGMVQAHRVESMLL